MPSSKPIFRFAPTPNGRLHLVPRFIGNDTFI
jgi:hypothetical protein